MKDNKADGSYFTSNKHCELSRLQALKFMADCRKHGHLLLITSKDAECSVDMMIVGLQHFIGDNEVSRFVMLNKIIHHIECGDDVVLGGIA